MPGSTATTVELPLDSPLSGNIDFAFDQDWYRFEVKTGSTYVFDLEGGATGAGTLGNPYLRLLDSEGNEIASNDDAGNPEQPDRVLGPRRWGDLRSARVPYGWNSDTGTYRLAAREVVGDASDSTATTATLAIGGSLKGVTDFVGDHDWYRVEVQAGHTYAFDLKATGDGNGSVVNPFLTLRDAEGNEIRSDDNGGPGSNAQLGFSATADTVLYVDASGADAGTGNYRLSAREVPHDQPDNETTSATLKVGGTVHAAVDFANDSDWFKAEVKAGHTYVVDVEGIATLAGTVGDPRVVLGPTTQGWFMTTSWLCDPLGAAGTIGRDRIYWPPSLPKRSRRPDDPDNWSQWTEDAGGNGHYYQVVTPPGGAGWQTRRRSGGRRRGASGDHDVRRRRTPLLRSFSDPTMPGSGDSSRTPHPRTNPREVGLG